MTHAPSKSLFLACLAFAVLSPVPAEGSDGPPASQPATQRPLDPAEALSLLRAGGVFYGGIRRAVDDGDLETAGMLTAELAKVTNSFLEFTRGSSLEHLAITGADQLARFQSAITAKDLAGARTEMKELDRIGELLGSAIKALQPPATQPK